MKYIISSIIGQNAETLKRIFSGNNIFKFMDTTSRQRLLNYFLFAIGGIAVSLALIILQTIYLQKSMIVPLYLFLPGLLGMCLGIFSARIFELNSSLQKATIKDPLTGLFNRKWFHSLLANELNRCIRYKQKTSLILFDIDDLKSVNENFGHYTGDLILEEVASIIRLSSRTTDLSARWGGEEFIILLPNTSLDGARILAERIRLTIENHNFPGAYNITCSFGLAQYKDENDTEITLIDKTDNALNRAKTKGKNRIETHS